jgi:PKD repeat protein
MKKRVYFLVFATTLLLTLSCRKLPLVAFTVSSTSISSGDSVVFTNDSKNAASYLWEFGDGNETFEKSPTYFFYESGVFTVKLSAYSEGGKASHSKTIDITVD